MTRRRFHPAFGVVAFVLAFLLTTSYAQQTRQTRAADARREQLAALVVDRQTRAAGLERELSELRTRTEALLRSRRGPVADLQETIEALEPLVGTTPLRGQGLIVTVADSPLAEEDDSPDYRIQDVDLQLVVNELWRSGAEAIAVNGQRIVSTTAIRSAGKAVLVNYRVLTSPYRIAAIGPAKQMESRFGSSKIAERFRTWSQVYRLSIKVDRRDALSLPAYTGRVRLGHAKPVESSEPN